MSLDFFHVFWRVEDLNGDTKMWLDVDAIRKQQKFVEPSDEVIRCLAWEACGFPAPCGRHDPIDHDIVSPRNLWEFDRVKNPACEDDIVMERIRIDDDLTLLAIKAPAKNMWIVGFEWKHQYVPPNFFDMFHRKLEGAIASCFRENTFLATERIDKIIEAARKSRPDLFD